MIIKQWAKTNLTPWLNMKGRCFDIEGNYWKTATPLTATNVHVHFGGLSGYTGTLQEYGWDFSVVENHFTKRKKLVMRNSAIGLVGSGEYIEDYIVIVRRLTNEKIFGMTRIRWQEQEHAINIDKLEIIDLLEAIARRQQKEMPVKPKPKAEIIQINQSRAV